MRAVFTIVLGLVLAGFAIQSDAHEVRPAYLQITETAAHRYDVLWKQPALGNVAVRLVPHLSNGWLEAKPTEVESTASFIIKRWRNLPATGLQGTEIRIEGLEHTITDVLVSVTVHDGQTLQTVLKAAQPNLTLEFNRHAGLSTLSYLRLGIEHILTGFDHLLFVLGLALLVSSRWKLAKTLSAFTVAHSLTLASTALGWISVQSRLIEALVALSIVFVAVELVHFYRGERHLTARLPWAIAFIFGLLHGFAFAGALAEVGLPGHAIAQSLLLFNVGVEIGQLAFVSVVWGVLWALSKLPNRWPAWSRLITPYAIGSCAVFWLLQRIFIGA